MLIGIPGNLITIIALARCKKVSFPSSFRDFLISNFTFYQVRNATAVFIINLSMSDLLFCCFNLPLAASTFYNREWVHGNFSPHQLDDFSFETTPNHCRRLDVSAIPAVPLRAPSSLPLHHPHNHHQSLRNDFTSSHLSEVS
jgi:hypothetical protein